MASLLGRLGGLVGSGIRAVSHIPGANLLIKAVPYASTALMAYDALGGALGGGGSKAPNMMMPPGGTPLKGTMSGPGTGMPYSPYMGKRSIFKNDPNIANSLKPYAIDDRFLKTYHRAPRGFVVLKDNVGDAFAIPKAIAIANHMWRPAKKPPISVRDWHHLLGANRVVKKFKEIEKKAMHIANFHSRRRAPAPAALPHGKKG